ncbi:virulence RhuM family protein, partial [Alcanivorax sp. HI0044]|uniref:virulence RhuM family protein n=2 Tax=unclassified Alcanivorax TaxID=2638842 RepID=UPI000AD0B32B
MNQGELILYHTDDGKAQILLRAEGDTVWLTQAEIATLFDTSKQNVSLHIRNILNDKELPEDSVVKESLTTAADGKNYRVKWYSLPLILAVGYRVRSPRGTQFRQWATAH